MKSPNLKKRSQFITMLIIVVALIGVLAINSEQVSADKGVLGAVSDAGTGAEVENGYEGFANTALPSLVKVGGALIVVVLAIYAGIFLLKKMMGKKYSGNKKQNILEVLETTYIGPKKTISLIKVANKAVLVASTETTISMLTEMDSVETAEILALVEVETTETDQFKNLFQAASNKIKEYSAKRDVESLLDVQPQTKS